MENHQTAKEYNAEFEVCQSIKVSLGNTCRVEFIDGEREKALVRAVGDPTFISFFSAEREPDRLLIDIKNPSGSAVYWKPYDREGYTGENVVQIFTGCADADVLSHNYLDLCAITNQNARGNHEVKVVTYKEYTDTL